MFVVTTSYDYVRYVSKDATALEKRLLDITKNEAEAKRIAAIAGNMKFGEVFSSPDIYLKCRIGEDV